MRLYDVDNPSTPFGCQRRGERHALVHSQDAFVEFIDPGHQRWRLDLLGISNGGVCFGLENGQPMLERGQRIERAVLEIGKARIEGALTIAHATEEFSVGTICGGQFQPATEADEQKLGEVIARLGW